MAFFKPSKVFAENKNKIFLSVTAPTPLGKISSPRFQLILKQVWVLCPKKILALPSCFILGVITPLNSEKLNGFLSGPPLRFSQYFYRAFPVREVWLHVNILMWNLLLWVAYVFSQLWDVKHVVDTGQVSGQVQLVSYLALSGHYLKWSNESWC